MGERAIGMKSAPSVLQVVRRCHRAGKSMVLMIAAWAPFLFPESPLLTGGVMAITTTVFFMITGPRSTER